MTCGLQRANMLSPEKTLAGLTSINASPEQAQNRKPLSLDALTTIVVDRNSAVRHSSPAKSLVFSEVCGCPGPHVVTCSLSRKSDSTTSLAAEPGCSVFLVSLIRLVSLTIAGQTGRQAYVPSASMPSAGGQLGKGMLKLLATDDIA